MKYKLGEVKGWVRTAPAIATTATKNAADLLVSLAILVCAFYIIGRALPANAGYQAAVLAAAGTVAGIYGALKFAPFLAGIVQGALLRKGN